MKYISALIFSLALGVYGWRLYQSHGKQGEQLFHFTTEGQSVLNEKAFQTVVERPYRDLLSDQMMTLIVFLDPGKLCPAVLDEANFWVSPREKMMPGLYDVQLFVSKANESDELYDFLNRHDLNENHVTFFAETGQEQIFAQFGILKILYSQDQGVLFHEFGNENSADFKALEKKILLSLQPNSHEATF